MRITESVIQDFAVQSRRLGMVDVEYRANQEMLEFRRKNGIASVDAVTQVREYIARWAEAPDGILDFTRAPFFKVDGHPSQVAHAMYAEALARFVSGSDHSE